MSRQLHTLRTQQHKTNKTLNKGKKKKQNEPKKQTGTQKHRGGKTANTSKGEERRGKTYTVQTKDKNGKPKTKTYSTGAKGARENPVNKFRGGVQNYIAADKVQKVATAPTKIVSGTLKNSQNTAGNVRGHGNTSNTRRNDRLTTKQQAHYNTAKVSDTTRQKKIEETKKKNEQNGYAFADNTIKKLDKTTAKINKSFDKTKKEALEMGASTLSDKKHNIPIYTKYVKGKAAEEAKKALNEGGVTRANVKKDIDNWTKEQEKKYDLSDDTVLEDGTTWAEYKAKMYKDADDAVIQQRKDYITNATKDAGKLSAQDAYKGGVPMLSEFIDYGVPYMATAKGSLKVAEKIMEKAAKAGKAGKAVGKNVPKVEKAVEDLVASGKLTPQAAKQLNRRIALKSGAKSVTKESLANAIQDATLGTAIDLGKGVSAGYEGDELEKYMKDNAIANLVMGAPMSAIAGRAGAKEARKLMAGDIAKQVNELTNLTKTEGIKLENLLKKQDNGTISVDEANTLKSLQDKALGGGTAVVNSKGKLEVNKAENALDDLSKTEVAEYYKLKAQDSRGTLDPRDRGRFEQLQNKVNTAYKRTEKFANDAINIKNRKIKSSDQSAMEDAVRFFERTGDKAKLEQAQKSLEIAKEQTRKLNDSLTNATEMMTDKTGVKYEWVDDEEMYARTGEYGNQGYTEPDGTVVINRDSPQAWQAVLGHETGHVIKKSNQEAFKALGDSLEKYAKDLDEWDSLVSEMKQKYPEYDIGGEDFREELISEMIGRYVFGEDSKFLKQLAGENPTAFEKIIEYIKNLLKNSDNKELAERLNKITDDVKDEIGKIKENASEIKENADGETKKSRMDDFDEEMFGELLANDREFVDGVRKDAEAYRAEKEKRANNFSFETNSKDDISAFREKLNDIAWKAVDGDIDNAEKQFLLNKARAYNNIGGDAPQITVAKVYYDNGMTHKEWDKAHDDAFNKDIEAMQEADAIGESIEKLISGGKTDTPNADAIDKLRHMKEVEIESVKELTDEEAGILATRLEELAKLREDEILDKELKESAKKTYNNSLNRHVIKTSEYDINVPEKSARYEDERIDDIINQFTNNGELKNGESTAYIALMNPDDFVKLTLSDKYRDMWENSGVLKSWDYETELKNLRQDAPYLEVDTDSGIVTGHEGRHRLLVMKNNGITSIPVVIRTKNGEIVNEPLSSFELKAQVDEEGKARNGARVEINDLVPASQKYKQNIKERFGNDARVKFSRAGKNAQGVDRDAFKIAEQWYKDGWTPKEIEDAIGVKVDTDGKAKFEFSDKDMKLKFKFGDYADVAERPAKTGHVTTLGDLIEHDEMFKYYPDLKDVPVYFDTKKRMGALGITRGTGEDIDVVLAKDIESEAELLDTILHEAQHIIQDVEGFSKGASPEFYADVLKRINEKLGTVEKGTAEFERLQNAKDELFGEFKGQSDIVKSVLSQPNQTVGSGNVPYLHTKGEWEARQTTKRRNMTQKELDETPREIDEHEIKVEDYKFSKGDIVDKNGKVTKLADDAYMKAAENGDTKAAQKMVDEVLKAQGYAIETYHGTDSFGFTEFDLSKSPVAAVFSTKDLETAKTYTKGEVKNVSEANGTGGIYKARLKMENPLVVDLKGGFWYDIDGSTFLKKGETYEPKYRDDFDPEEGYFTADIAEYAKENGYDGVIFKNMTDEGEWGGNATSTDVYAIFDSSQFKVSDAVTRDNNGDIIPLSQRGDSSKKDIRYSRAKKETPTESISDTRAEIKKLDERLSGKLKKAKREELEAKRLELEETLERQEAEYNKAHKADFEKNIEDAKKEIKRLEAKIKKTKDVSEIAKLNRKISGQKSKITKNQNRLDGVKKSVVNETAPKDLSDSELKEEYRRLKKTLRIGKDKSIKNRNARQERVDALLKEAQERGVEVRTNDELVSEIVEEKRYGWDEAKKLNNKVKKLDNEIAELNKQLKKGGKDAKETAGKLRELENERERVSTRLTKIIDNSKSVVQDGESAIDAFNRIVGGNTMKAKKPKTKGGSVIKAVKDLIEEKGSVKEAAKDVGQTIRRKGESSTIEFETTGKKLLKSKDAESKMLGQALVDQANNVVVAKNKSAAAIESHRASADGTQLGESLNDVFTVKYKGDTINLLDEANTEMRKDLSNYLFAKHSFAREAQNKKVFGQIGEDGKPLWTNASTDQYMRELCEKYGDGDYEKGKKILDKFEHGVREYIDYLNQYRLDTGLISKEFLDKLNDIYPYYVPTHRVNVDKAPEIWEMPKTLAEVQNGIKQAVGSGDDLEDLYTQLAKMTISTISSGEQNKMIAMYAKAKGIDPMQVPKEATPEDVLDTAISAYDNNGKWMIQFYKDGEVARMPVDKQAAKGLRELGGQDYATFMEVSAKAGKLLHIREYKGFITDWNLIFGLRNGMRDAQQALVNSKDSRYFVLSTSKAMHAVLNEDSAFRVLYDANGGRYSTLQQINRLDEIGALNKEGGTIKKGMQKIEDINGIIEMMPRMCEFIGTLQKEANVILKDDGGIKGLRRTIEEEAKAIDPELRTKWIEDEYAKRIVDVIKEKKPNIIATAIRNSADITVNFARNGVITKGLNAGFVPYLNPSVQGLSKMARMFTESRGKALFAFMAKLTLMTTSLSMANEILCKDNEAYQSLNTRDKDNNFFIPMAIFGGDKDKFIKIPKPRENSVLVEPAVYVTRYILDNAQYGTKDEFAQMFKSANENIGIVNVWEDNIFSPILNTAMNKTWYGGDILSKSELKNIENGEAWKNYDETTSLFAQKMGKLTNLSPKKIDNIMDSYMGLIYDYGISQTSKKNLSEVWSSPEQALKNNFVAQQFTKDAVFSNKFATQFWSKADELNKGKKDGEDTLEYKQFMAKYGDASFTYDTAIKGIDSEKKLSEKEKIQMKRELRTMKNQLYQRALKGEEVKYDPMQRIINLYKRHNIPNATDKCLSQYAQGDHADAYNYLKTTKEYRDASPEGKKKLQSAFLNTYKGVNRIARQTGDRDDFVNYSYVAYVCAKKGYDGGIIANAYCIKQKEWSVKKGMERAHKYIDDGYTDKNFIATFKALNEGAYEIGKSGAYELDNKKWASKLDDYDKAMIFAEKGFRDGAYYIASPYLDTRMNAARCLKEGHSDKSFDWNDKRVNKFCSKYKIRHDKNYDWDLEYVAESIQKEYPNKTDEEKAALYVVITGEKENPFGEIGDYSHDNDTGIFGEEDDKKGGRGRRGRRGHRGGGGGGGGGKTPFTPVVNTAGGAAKQTVTAVKVSSPFGTSNTSKKSTLNDAYRKKARKLREKTYKRS